MPLPQNIENSDLASEDQVYLMSSEHEEFGRSQYKSTWHDNYLQWLQLSPIANFQFTGLVVFLQKNMF
jgi:hypothetical protein